MTQVFLKKNVSVNDQLHVDVYHQGNKGNLPVVLFCPGGAWQIATKRFSQDPCLTLTENGFLTVACEYSLSALSANQTGWLLLFLIVPFFLLALCCSSRIQFAILITVLVIILTFWMIVFTINDADPNCQHPQHVQDVASALDWVYHHVHEYGGNPDQIFMMGHSAGGHLASLLTTNSHYLPKSVPRDVIKGCVAISGVYSDKRLQETTLGKNLLETAFGRRSHYYDAFPIYHIQETTPPFLLINAENDISLKSHAFDFHYALRGRGVYVESVTFPDTNHFTIIKDWSSSNSDVFIKIKSFLQEAMTLKTTPSS